VAKGNFSQEYQKKRYTATVVFRFQESSKEWIYEYVAIQKCCRSYVYWLTVETVSGSTNIGEVFAWSAEYQW